MISKIAPPSSTLKVRKILFFKAVFFILIFVFFFNEIRMRTKIRNENKDKIYSDGKSYKELWFFYTRKPITLPMCVGNQSF